MEYRNLNNNSVSLNKAQLEQYLEKLASDHILQKTSNRNTYPIPKLEENFTIIEETYHLLNEHIKIGIPIHPAGEWLLDNFYIIEETVKTIKENMTLSKYREFVSIANGQDAGFARIYVLAAKIVNYTDNQIDSKNLSSLLSAYQKKKTLSMEEIWNIGIFMQIALIQNITNICEKIYYSQMQKYRAENILERLVEKKQQLKFKNLSEYRTKVKGYGEMKYPFIEYLSYRLKMQGKIANPFIDVLEEQVNKMGTSIEEVIRKEHYDIALKKVAMANCITSIKELVRMDFLTVFEQSNKIEEVLKQDPAGVYPKMDLKTREEYRNSIQEIAKKTKIAEIYIVKKALKLSMEGQENTKESHIGYYLISNGKQKLYEELGQKQKKQQLIETKVNLYICSIWAISLVIDMFYMSIVENKIKNTAITILFGLFLILPVQEIVVQTIQYVLGKVVKPKLIPKIDLSNGVPESASTFVVIPTILKSKEKVKDLIQKLEVYYLANKSENLYFALLGDCSSGQNKEEPFDKEVIEEGLKQVKILNEKYKCKEFQKFHFIYRKRNWNGEEECYLGWERKRGLLNQFNEYLLNNIENPFRVNTLEVDSKKEDEYKKIKKNIKYIITLDADTELILNSATELIGAMEHILNKPILNKKEDVVINGHALIQPRIGITLDAANKNTFTKIFAGNGGTDAYTNAISDVYQDNFDEGIFTGKGIYNLRIFSKVLSNEIPENTVLSHDLLEGNYLRCALASDIMLMDGYPTSYLSSKQRQNRWIRGDFQIAKWANKKIVDKKEIRKENPLNSLSRYKIIDNLIRAVTPIFSLIEIILICILNILYKIKFQGIFAFIIISVMFPTILEVINRIIYRKQGQNMQKTFAPRINSLLASIIRGIISLIILPDKAWNNLNAICKTIYRVNISKKHLLEWTTSEETEKLAKTDLLNYYRSMISNIILGVIRNNLFFSII